jgi:hypothetical protein
MPATAETSSDAATRQYSRRSSATWSLRERPVCSAAPAGVISVSRRSTAVWMSSSVARNLNSPLSSSRLTRRRPRSIDVSFVFEMMPAAASPRACAMLPAMSNG